MIRKFLASATAAGLVALPAVAQAAPTVVQAPVIPTAKGQAVPVIAKPLLVMPGLSGPAGSFTLRANGLLPGLGAVAPTGANATMMLGLTDRLGLNVIGNFTRTAGLVGGYWNQAAVEGQYSLLQAPDKSSGLSLVGAAVVPSGPAGLNLAGVHPEVGLRALTTLGIGQTNLGAMYDPLGRRVDFGAGFVMQAGQALAPSLDIVGSAPIGGGAFSLGIAPGVQFGLTPGIRLGVGYMIPIRGTPTAANNILANVQLGF